LPTATAGSSRMLTVCTCTSLRGMVSLLGDSLGSRLAAGDAVGLGLGCCLAVGDALGFRRGVAAGTILAPFATDAPDMDRRGLTKTLVLVVGTALLAPRVVTAVLGFCLVVMVGAAFLGTFLFCRGGSPVSSFWMVMLN
jgi:hypothetical protein